ETLSRFINDTQFNLHNSEWDEGGTLCILDFCCKPGSAHLCLEHLKRVHPIVERRTVVWRSRRTGRLMTVKNKEK
ncbi:hypothetical protein ABT075_47075, partial [Streptomyces sp. NPDC002677]|uniref:hypothetical protein n=1 Tax=Streptomyces sp. NPDC002677 TaxID=3154774 RepID=UPI00331B81BB